MRTAIFEHLGVSETVNAVGYATRVGGGFLSAEVAEAMRDAQRACVEIDDLHAAASRIIAEHTGAEAGLVTCGAAAGLTLAAAACLAGNDPEAMDALPDTRGLARYEIVYPHTGRYHYDHPLRAAGARLVQVDYDASNALARIEAAIGPRTAALGYAWHRTEERPALADLAALARRRRLPLIMDAAMALPPAGNLRRFVALGADLVVFSGGKHLGGPQASGLLCGRQDLVRSAWAQMVDMDVRERTWSLRAWVDEGWIARPPRHGIGRSMKAGKEAIAGVLTALRAYARRDHEGEAKVWHARARTIHRGLASIDGLRASLRFPSPTGQAYPVVQLDLAPSGEGLCGLIAHLRRLRPKIVLAEDEDDPNRAFVYPLCLQEGEAEYIVSSIREILSRRSRS